VWYFESIDMLHKMLLTTALQFLSIKYQMILGMAIVVLYLIIILLVHPYSYRSHDRLHLLAQTCLYMYLLAGYVFYNLDIAGELDSTGDILMGVIILIDLGFFFFMFILSLFPRLRRWFFIGFALIGASLDKSKRAIRTRFMDEDDLKEEQEKSFSNIDDVLFGGIEMEETSKQDGAKFSKLKSAIVSRVVDREQMTT